MIINIDVDGVIADMIQLAIVVAYRELGVLINREDITNFYYENEEYSIPHIVEKYILKNDMMLYAPVVSGSVSTINKLRSFLGLTINIVSARPPELKKLTQDWLKIKGFKYDNLVLLGDSSKGDVGGLILVDDHSKNVVHWLDSSKEKFAVLYPQPWNRRDRDRLVNEYPSRILIPSEGVPTKLLSDKYIKLYGYDDTKIWESIYRSVVDLVDQISGIPNWSQMLLPLDRNN